jgi:hypothetical protein
LSGFDLQKHFVTSLLQIKQQTEVLLMVDYWGNRFRVRTVPISSGEALVKIGKVFIETSPFSNQWVQTSDLTGPHPFPWFIEESCWDEKHPGPPYKTGGPFRKIRFEYLRPWKGVVGEGTFISNSSNHTISGFGTGRMKYVGGFLPPSTFPWSAQIIDTASAHGRNSSFVPDISTLEGQAWDKTKPPLERGGLAVALAEARDGKRMAKTSFGLIKEFASLYKSIGGNGAQKILSPRKAADHFLNHNFGWVPFVKDLEGIIDNLSDRHARLERMRFENGKWIRRRAILVNQSGEDPVPGWSGTGAHGYWPAGVYPLDDCYAGTPSWSFTNKWSTYASSVGSFRYYLPYFDSQSPDYNGLWNSIQRDLKLHGALLNPVHVYKATPWTWMIDWFTDTGRTISSLNDQYLDNIAASYFFISHRDLQEITCKQVLPFNGLSGGSRTLAWSRIIDVKQRKRAESPFGFGPSLESLTPKQLAIMGALGLSRSKGLAQR